MILKDIVARCADDLTDADRRLVELLLADPGEGAFQSAARLGEKAGVHAATVVRMSRKLGFNGFPELQAKLQEELLAEADPARRLKKRLERIATGDILAELVAGEREMLGMLPDYVSQADVATAADMLWAADTVFVFAYGHATALGELALRRLRRYGIKVADLRYQGRELAERLLTVTDRDVVLGFTFRRVAPGLARLVDRANRIGARSILITDLLIVEACPTPTLSLAATRGRDMEYLTLSVPMLILNAIVLTMAQAGDKRSRIDGLGDLIQDFEADRSE